jgi:Ubiquinone biosynthesis protein COQ7
MSDLDGLAAILRGAYSGELAAALAYRGHWHSVRDPGDRARIRQIEEEEWHHRDLVGAMLARIGAEPSGDRERRARAIGRTLGVLCHAMGWLAPMYGAGRLERGNIVEYETAARLAVRAGWPELVDCLLTMAEVEWDHEQYFRSRVQAHRLAGWLPIWPAPPPRREIRDSFARETVGAGGTAPAPPSPPVGDRALVPSPDGRPG